MMSSFLSPIYWYGNYLRLCFVVAGLTSQLTNLDNGDTTVHFWGPNSINTTKPSLVLIHGFGPVPTWQWRNQVTYFAPKFNVYVPELIFFGQSTTRLADRSEQFQADIVAKLMEKIGVKKYSVVGTSYGGFVAYNVAKRWANRVDKVVIASSATNMRLRDGVELLKRAKVEKIQDLFLPTTVAQLRTLLSLTVYNFFEFVPYSLLDDMLQKLFFDNREEKSELFDGLTIGRDNQARVVDLNKEVLLVWGDHDQIFPIEETAFGKECEVGGLTSQITNLDNGKTSIHFWGPKFINTTKPSMVLIHGFGPVPTWQWRNQVTYFAPKFNVYVPELIFFGQSTTQLADRSEQFQADTVAKLMEKIGVKKYSVVGTSYGGFVAYNVAKRWADRVDKVVIASSATNIRLRDSMELLKRAKVEKIQDLFLPTTVARLRTLLTLT
ncbi:hypothetical protein G4B88_007360, partial [Cannabis sativa]